MLKIARLLALLCAAILLVGLSGCVTQETDPTSSSTWLSGSDEQASQLYQEACAAVYSQRDIILEYTVDRQREVGSQTFTELVDGSVTVKNLRREDMVAVVSERLLFGTLETAYKEIFCDGKTFVQVNDSRFFVEADAEDYMSRQYPMALISADYYKSVYAQPDGEGNTLIHFAEPLAMEPWLRRDARVQLQSAAGTALVDGKGQLLQTTYRIRYLCQDVLYSEVITMKVTVPKELDIGGVHPEHFENCPVIENPDALKLLLRAVGDVYSSEYISSRLSQVIDSAAVPVRYEQSSSYLLQGFGESLYAKAEHESSVTDYRGVPVPAQQTDLFEEGVFTVAVNGGAPQKQELTARDVRSYFEDAVLSAVFNPRHISAVQLEIGEEYYQLTFEGNAAFEADVMAMLGQVLQMDLDAVSQSAQTLTAGGYLKLDRATGLPVSMGIELTRKHTLNSVSYDLTYRLEQTVSLLAAE